MRSRCRSPVGHVRRIPRIRTHSTRESRDVCPFGVRRIPACPDSCRCSDPDSTPCCRGLKVRRKRGLPRASTVMAGRIPAIYARNSFRLKFRHGSAPCNRASRRCALSVLMKSDTGRHRRVELGIEESFPWQYALGAVFKKVRQKSKKMKI